MANTITAGIDGDNRTIDIHLEALQQKVDDAVEDACRWLYTTKKMFVYYDEEDPPQPITFDSLTNKQRLDIFLKAVVYFGKEWATNKYLNEYDPQDQSQREVEAENKYDLGTEE